MLVELAQMVTRTNAHPYRTQLISLWFSVAPALIVLALVLFVAYWQFRRAHKKRHSAR